MTPTEIAARMRAERVINKLLPTPPILTASGMARAEAGLALEQERWRRLDHNLPPLDEQERQAFIANYLASEQSVSSPNAGAGLPECTCALCKEAATAAASHARAVAAAPGKSIFDAISWDEVAKPPTGVKIEAPFEGIDFEEPMTFRGRMKDGRAVLIHHVDLQDKWPAIDDRGLVFEAYTSAFRSSLDGEEGPWAFSHVDRIAAEGSGDPLKFRGNQDMLFLSNAGVEVDSII